MNGSSLNGFAGEFLRGALDVAPDGVVICEAAGERAVVYVNPAFCRLTGYETAELLGKNLRFLQGEDRDQPELETVREALRHGEGVRALLRNQRKDGTVFVNDMQLHPLKDSEGKVTHLVTVDGTANLRNPYIVVAATDADGEATAREDGSFKRGKRLPAHVVEAILDNEKRMREMVAAAREMHS